MANEIEVLARKLLKKDGEPRANVTEEALGELQALRDANPDLKLWFEEGADTEHDDPDMNKEQKWSEFWNGKGNDQVRLLTTETGRVRGGLGPNRIAKARGILKEYGF